MARSSLSDPIEKFRFQVEILPQNKLLGDLKDVSALSSIISGNKAGLEGLGVALLSSINVDQIFYDQEILTRAGFSEVSLPKANINEILYRENINSPIFTRIPGLTKFEPMSFKRGVTKSQDLYSWYLLVCNVHEGALSQIRNEGRSTSPEPDAAVGVSFISDNVVPPVQSASYRRDVIIRSLDRTGQTVKMWRLFNCWPISYKGGNDLQSQSEEKLVEELVITYEFFIENVPNQSPREL